MYNIYTLLTYFSIENERTKTWSFILKQGCLLSLNPWFTILTSTHALDDLTHLLIWNCRRLRVWPARRQRSPGFSSANPTTCPATDSTSSSTNQLFTPWFFFGFSKRRGNLVPFLLLVSYYIYVSIWTRMSFCDAWHILSSFYTYTWRKLFFLYTYKVSLIMSILNVRCVSSFTLV